MKKLFCLVLLSLTVSPRVASALVIDVNYDSSVTTATNAAAIETAFAAAVRTLEELYTNNATVHITMYWGPSGPFTGGISLGRSQFELVYSSYSEITNALSGNRASAADTNSVASLPGTDPTGGPWLVPLAEARVLNFDLGGLAGDEDGEVGFATNKSYTFDPNNRIVAGEYDFIGVAEHEISEVLGRDTYGLQGGFVPYDLFRFTNNADRSFDRSATNAYFSVDDGVTVLRAFYTNYMKGDVQDWKTSGNPDAFDAVVPSGHLLPLSSVDITALDVLGYNGPGLAAPQVAGTRLSNGSFQLSFANTPGTSFTILATTNPAVHLANWSVLGTATENPPGWFQFTDTSATNGQRFYEVRSP